MNRTDLPVVDQKIASKCPCCESEERAGLDFVEKIEERGLIPKQDEPEDILQLKLPFAAAAFAPANLSAMMPWLQISFAVCADCGCIYCTRIFSFYTEIQQTRGMPPMGRMN